MSDNFSSVWDVEHARLRARHPHLEAHKEDAAQPEMLKSGLCLSGGGIRSAAFSLGIVQALQALKAFPNFDYLSTVSGGGYLGGALLAGLYRTNGAYSLDSSQINREMAPADIADNAEVLKIRDRSRYLMPNGVFDLVVSLAIILRGLAVNAVIVAAFVFGASALTLFMYPTQSTLSHSWIYNFVDFNRWTKPAWFPALFDGTVPLTKIAVVAFLFWLVIWAVWRSIIASVPGRFEQLQDPASPIARATAKTAVVLAALFVVELQVPILRYLSVRPSLDWKSFATIAAPLTAGTGLFAFLWKRLELLIQAAEKDKSRKAGIGRFINYALLIALGAALPLLIYASYLALTLYGLNHINEARDVATLTPSFAISAFLVILIFVPVGIMIAIVLWSVAVGPLGLTLLSRQSNDSAVKSRRKKAAWLILGVWLFMFALGALCAHAIVAPLTFWYTAFFYLGVCTTLTAVSALFAENANSLHRLYRDRLAEAFEISGIDRGPITFSQLAALDVHGLPRRPYPIINAAVNMQGSKRLGRRRKADFFTFTPDYIGSEATGYLPTATYSKAEPDLDLATAIAISGAAVSSAMGQVGRALFTPTFSLLNLRLGYWVRNPRCVKTDEELSRARLQDWRFSYLAHEITGRLNEEMGRVLLSDGGHIDNLGLYQLLKRRCDFIIVSDAEADPTMNFSALITVERYARIDLGVRLELPFQAIAEQAVARKTAMQNGLGTSFRGKAWQHAAIGTVKYPPVVRGDGHQDLPEKTGVILYIKACLTGDERSYVLDYERRFPSFPHEPTGDQFFSEEQFEAYRALGFHACETALEHSDESVRWASLLNALREHLEVVDAD
ncbi:patatin-like phospholipase family protein [Rhizobium rhizogenes]|uniref:patatin-like phospholipase family protein n=1 Tax=Rhizobium rhizogenes TaxID=359 RepID=UPI002271978F|nr:patatin-like phospholipase family protein [Rhizobium rhizogenes]